MCLKESLKQESKVTKHTFNETMGVHDSFREAFTSRAVNTKETKVRGSDHREEFRIGHG